MGIGEEEQKPAGAQAEVGLKQSIYLVDCCDPNSSWREEGRREKISAQEENRE